MKDLTLVFRDKREGVHSIEKLFACLTPHFRAKFDVGCITLPRQPSGLSSIFANMRYARKHAKGVIHITGDAQYLGIFLPRRRTILTVHDCEYLQRLKGWKKFVYRLLWFSLPCALVGRITVISESTKAVLESEIGDLGDRIEVIRNCVTLASARKSGTFNSACPKILQIGSGRHKNLDNLIRAVDGVECELKIVGRISDENLAELERRKIRYSSEYQVSDERILEIYAECDILFFASRHEGFGLPILEAQETGIPVITSTCYSMPEVAGEGALLVDPESPEQIREAIESLCGQPILREQLLEHGWGNVKKYGPEAVSAQYLDLYQRVAESL